MLFTLILFLVNFVSILTNGYIITLENKSECFIERLQIGQKATFYYETNSPDLDYYPLVSLFDPNGREIISEKEKKDNEIPVVAEVSGDFKYCFENPSHVPTQTVFFNFVSNFDVLTGQKTYDATHNDIVDMTNKLSNEIHKIKSEILFMEIRGDVHKNVNESTNFRVVIWAAFEALIILAMSVGQVVYLKRFFEVRRMI